MLKNYIKKQLAKALGGLLNEAIEKNILTQEVASKLLEFAKEKKIIN